MQPLTMTDPDLWASASVRNGKYHYSVEIRAHFLYFALPPQKQQHVIPERRQRKQGSALRLPELRLQTGSRLQLHLREQNYARN